MKKFLLWTGVIVLAIGLWMFVYLLPVTRGYFLPGEKIELHYIDKTTLHVPEGETVERYSNVDWSDEDILERVDTDTFLKKLPEMRITVFQEYKGSRWVGDVTYEINGYIHTGLRKGTHFHIDLGIPEESHLRINGRNRAYRIMEPEKWIALLESLES